MWCKLVKNQAIIIYHAIHPVYDKEINILAAWRIQQMLYYIFKIKCKAS